MTTLRLLAEQVVNRFAGYAPGTDLEVSYSDVYPHLIQQINALLKTEYVQVKMRLGDDHVQEAAMATFTDLDVIPYEQELVIGCEAFDDTWPDNPTSGASLSVTQTGEGLYEVEVSDITFPAGKTALLLSSFVNQAALTSYIEFDFGFPDYVFELPTKFARSAMKDITTLDVTDGFKFTYDLLDVGLAPAEVRSAVRKSGLSLKGVPSLTGGITVSSFNRCGPTYASASLRSAVLLPVQPLSLPYGQGVWRVFDPNTPDDPWIPIPNAYYGMTNQVTHTGLANFLDGQNTYTWFGEDRIVFNVPSNLMPDKMAVQLAVVTADKVGDFDPLPVPADYEAEIVEQAFAVLVKIKMPDYQPSSTDEQ